MLFASNLVVSDIYFSLPPSFPPSLCVCVYVNEWGGRERGRSEHKQLIVLEWLFEGELCLVRPFSITLWCYVISLVEDFVHQVVFWLSHPFSSSLELLPLNLPSTLRECQCLVLISILTHLSLGENPCKDLNWEPDLENVCWKYLTVSRQMPFPSYPKSVFLALSS